MLIDTLNKKFAIKDSVTFSSGKGGLPKVTLREKGGDVAEAFLYGAHVSRWNSAKAGELLFMSTKSDFSGTKPIRGGVPLVFPQFGTGVLPAHGVLRTLHWDIVATELLSSGAVKVVFEVSDSDATRAVWPQQFTTTLTVELSSKLTMTLKAKNLDSTEFPIQAAFHSYFSVQDITQTSVENLKGLTYLDSTKNRAEGIEDRTAVTFNEQTDRIYLNAADTILIKDQARKLTFSIKKANMPDAVVWNPWIERCKAIADLEPDGYLRYVCVEPGVVANPVVLKPGSEWSCTQEISYNF